MNKVSEAATPTAAWTVPLKAAATTLVSVPTDVISGISLSGRLGGVPGEQLLLPAAVERLSQEFGLEAVVTFNGDQFTIRLTRSDWFEPPLVSGPTANRTVLEIER